MIRDPLSPTLKGGFLILVMTFIWIASSELNQAIQQGFGDNRKYDKPFLNRIMQTIALILYIPIVFMHRYWTMHWKKESTLYHELVEPLERSPGNDDEHNVDTENMVRQSSGAGFDEFRFHFKPLLVLAVPSVIGYTIMGYTWFLSLPLTKVSTNTALYQVYVLINFGLSVIYMKEKVTRAKTISVIAAFVGVIVISSSSKTKHPADSQGYSTDEPRDTVWGIVLVLFSSFLYSVYQIGFSMKIDPSIPNRTLLLYFTGLQGFVMTMLGIPLVFLWHMFGFETYEPPNQLAWSLWFLNGVSSLAYIPIMYAAISFTSPSFVAVGCTLTIPVSVIADIVLHQSFPNVGQLVGSFCIMAGLVGFSVGG